MANHSAIQPQSTTSPPKWAEHSLLKGRLFYAIPLPLIESIERHVHQQAFGELRDLELAVAEACQSEDCIGSSHGQPVKFEFFAPTESSTFTNRTISIDHSVAEQLGWDWNAAKLQLRLGAASERVDLFRRTARGYLGWLLTNNQFQKEQNALLTATTGTEPSDSMPSCVESSDDYQLVSSEELARRLSNDVGYLFLKRWRLRKLVTTNLPVPMMPLWAGQFPASILPMLQDTGGLFHLPDTFPVPSRDELRQFLQEGIASTEEVEHLAEWHQIVRGDNPAKNQIDRYARIAAVFHYWRVVMSRHRPALRGKTQALQRAFASFLHKTDATIKGDLGLIRQRLGDDWAL